LVDRRDTPWLLVVLLVVLILDVGLIVMRWLTSRRARLAAERAAVMPPSFGDDIDHQVVDVEARETIDA
jgi:cytochrome c oxidase subunit IV